MSARSGVDVAEASRKRLHDLRAPLITMQGFGTELAEAVGRLVRLVDTHRSALPDEYSAQAREVLEKDIAPCLGFLQSSMDKLQAVLDGESERGKQEVDR